MGRVFWVMVKPDRRGASGVSGRRRKAPVAVVKWLRPELRADGALALGNLRKASAIGSRLLARPGLGGEWNRGNRLHWGHIILGRVALRQGGLAAAEQHLQDAANVSGSPQLNSFGPDFDLANELLEHGRRDAVLDYLDRCKRF